MQRFSKQCFRSRSISFTYFQFQQVELYTHIMYKKEELEAMEIPQLMGIANELGIKVSQDSALEDVIYAIIDKAAENSAETSDDAPKKKRTRIAKKDTSKVYTVKGKDGENLDSKSNRSKKAEPASLFSDEPQPAPETEEKPAAEPEAPKRRTRKTKAAAEEASAKLEEVVAEEQQPEPQQEMQEDIEAVVPEAMESTPEAADEVTADAMEKLREKMANRKEQEFVPEDSDVWAGDPGDGTDFITVVDIPIEDQEALPTLHGSQTHLSLTSRILLPPMAYWKRSPMAMASSAALTITICRLPMISTCLLSRLRNTV